MSLFWVKTSGLFGVTARNVCSDVSKVEKGFIRGGGCFKTGKATITVSRLHEKFTLEGMKGIQKKLKNENSSENWKVKLVEGVRINGKRL